MKLRAILALVLALPLALGGCGKKDEAPKQAAGGELLPRSVTDEMPPYDTVTSQPPLADPGAGDEQGAARKRGGASGPAADDEVDGPVVPAPGPTPAPTSTPTVRPTAE